MINQNNKLRFDGTKAMREARSVTTECDRKSDYGIVDAELALKVTSFDRVFKGVVAGGDIKRTVEIALEKSKGEAIGVEFGGMGINLFKGFSDGFFKQTIGVSLSDYRTESGQLKEGSAEKIYPDGRQHNIIIGNLFDREVYQKINEIIDGKKVDFIIERMIAGLGNVPKNFLTTVTILQKWYSMLSEGGMLLVELPGFAISVVEEWVKVLQSEKYERALYVSFDKFARALRIQKLEKAPAKLPVLKIDEIKNILKKEAEFNHALSSLLY